MERVFDLKKKIVQVTLRMMKKRILKNGSIVCR